MATGTIYNNQHKEEVMTINEARLIRELKKRCTYRALAEIYYSKDDLEYGNQLYGEDLCKEALEILYPMTLTIKYKKTKKFQRDNKSYIGDFYWWE
jgi:hypothetical protein